MQNSGSMRFKLTYRDLGMLTRNLVKNIVHHINNAQLQQVRNTYKVYKTSTQCKQGMYVGGSSAKGIFACVSVSATAKTNILF